MSFYPKIVNHQLAIQNFTNSLPIITNSLPRKTTPRLNSLERNFVTTRNFRSFSKPRQFTIHKLLFIIYYSLITIHRFLGQFDILRSVQKFYYSLDTIHFGRNDTIHVHYSCHRKLSLRVFKIRVTVLVQEQIHTLSLGHFIQTRNSQHIIFMALAYYSTRRVFKLYF